MPVFRYPFQRGATFVLAAFSLMAAPFVTAQQDSPYVIPSSPSLNEEELGVSMGIGAIPDGIDVKEVRDVIAVSFAARGWTVKSKKEDHVIGFLAHRGREATMTAIMDFEANEIRYFIDGWAVSKTGERKKRDNCESWVTFIKKDVNKRLNIAAAKL